MQSITPLPLQIDSSNAKAGEDAVRVYCGKPIINSVNGKKESMDEILPIVKKYGASVVALTLDESGIPETAEGRFKIAEKIVAEAEKYGIPKTDIFVDCLVLTASTNQSQVMETLKAIKLVKQELGVKTVLGVSNVSFGLPSREVLNSAYLAAAFGAGLDMPILNPLSKEYQKIVSAFKVLNNEDKGAEKYIAEYSDKPQETVSDAQGMDIKSIIINGLKGSAEDAVKELLKTKTPLEIINEEFIPALDIVGGKVGYDSDIVGNDGDILLFGEVARNVLRCRRGVDKHRVAVFNQFCRLLANFQLFRFHQRIAKRQDGRPLFHQLHAAVGASYHLLRFEQVQVPIDGCVAVM